MTTSHRSNFALLAIAFSLLIATAAMAREAVITLKDGRTFKGEVLEETDKAITLRISGIATPYTRDLIQSVEFIKTVEEEYAERRSKVKDDDVRGRYAIARWLYDKRAYAMSQKELAELAALAPNNADVTLLRRIVEEKIKADAAVTPGPGPVTDAPKAGDLPTDRLTAKQINRIRVLEINENATPAPRISVPLNVVDAFLTKYADNELVPKVPAEKNRFKAQKDLEKLKLMLQVGAREFYDDVVSHDDPPAIRDFRLLHRTYVLSFCATNDCHGGAKAGRFFLFASAPTSNETIHTNFYILTQSKPKAGYMVDRDYPSRSLLIQYGLPLDKAATPHPDVPGFRSPMVTVDKDRTYQMLIEWISKSLYRPEPKYDLDYRIPTLTPPAKPEAPAPVTPPAPKPATP